MKYILIIFSFIFISCSDSSIQHVDVKKKCDLMPFAQGMYVDIIENDTSYKWITTCEYYYNGYFFGYGCHQIIAINKVDYSKIIIDIYGCGFKEGNQYLGECIVFRGKIPNLGLYWNDFLYCQQRGTLNIICISDEEIEGEFNIELDDNHKTVNLIGKFKTNIKSLDSQV